MTASPSAPREKAFSRNDAELLTVVMCWGLNLPIAKFALADLSPLAYNGLRFGTATAILCAVMLTRRSRGASRIGRRDIVSMALLGLVGHAAYQVFFIEGLARTTATHCALIFGVTPVLVALLSFALGHERPGALVWTGALVAFGGIYVIVAGEPPPGGPAPTAAGDLLILAATLCWAVYTSTSRPVLVRHPALEVTSLTMAWGSLVLIPACVPSLVRQPWGSVGPAAWGATLYGMLFPLVVAYLLWYRSIRSVGSVRTSIYSNLVPVVGALAGWL
ncbi:MAG TPA: DMT family transporter, partial [Candidatus Saccharimonadales bacterium]|nr:DMT family transporter [Candidatus Saccharimonadales bacterium]